MSERVGVERKNTDRRDIPTVGSFVLESGDKSRVKQNKNAFKASRVRRKYIRGKEESLNDANGSPSTTGMISPGFFHWLTCLIGRI